MKQQINSNNAPKAIGPYSQAIDTGTFVFASGQLPIDPQTGLMPSDIEGQTRQSLANVNAVLESAGLTMDNVVKTTVFLADMNDFAAMNSVYESIFNAPYPARSAVAVKTLPKNALIEIEVIASR